MSRRVSLAELLRIALDRRANDTHVALPGIVQRYDATSQKADVQPAIKGTFADELGDSHLEDLPVIVNVPIVFPGAGGYRVTFPVGAGDSVLLVFSESSIDKWLRAGGASVDPADPRRFALSDAIAIPGLRDFAHALADAPTDRATFGLDGGMQIHIDPSTISLGGDVALEHAALGDALTTYLGLLDVWLTGLALATSPTYATPRPPIPTLSSSAVKIKP